MAFLGAALGAGNALGNLIGGFIKKKPAAPVSPALGAKKTDSDLALDKQIAGLTGTVGADDAGTTQAKDFYQTILGGSQEATGALLGPQVNTILSQFDSGMKAVDELAPKGGGRNALLAETPFKKAAAYGNLLEAAQPAAASGLAQIGSQTAAKNANLLSTLLSSRDRKEAQAADQAFSTGEAAKARKASALSSIGSTIGSVLLSSLLNKGKTGTK